VAASDLRLCAFRAVLIQLYVNEAGEAIASEEFEPNREPWSFAQVLLSIPEPYRCLACDNRFREHPGAAVECPRCRHIYAQVE
jgi:hypothetical protein